MKPTLGRRARLLTLVLVSTAALVVVATPASAATTSVTVTNTCSGYAINGDGTTGVLLPPGTPFPLNATVPTIGAPTEVNAGTSFNGVGASIQVPVPDQVDTKVPSVGVNGVVQVYAAANIRYTIEIDGAASIGTPKLSGPSAVIGGTVKKLNANQIEVLFPGSEKTDLIAIYPGGPVIPGEEHTFPPGKNFKSPKLTVPVTAGAAGSTISFKLVKFDSDSAADVFNQKNGFGLPTRATCTPPANSLGTVKVVTPPPPGAPDAVADVATTKQNTAVTVDVLANDQPNNEGQDPDPSTLAITSGPAHGTATIGSDHTVTYTPTSGFVGTDTFTYKVCDAVEIPTTTTTAPTTSTTTTTIVIDAARKAQRAQPAATTLKCDTASVTVTVEAPVTDLTTQTTAAAAASGSSNTSASSELPRTGRSSAPLAAFGVALCVLGAGALALGRRRTRSA